MIVQSQAFDQQHTKTCLIARACVRTPLHHFSDTETICQVQVVLWRKFALQSAVNVGCWFKMQFQTTRDCFSE